MGRRQHARSGRHSAPGTGTARAQFEMPLRNAGEEVDGSAISAPQGSNPEGPTLGVHSVLLYMMLWADVTSPRKKLCNQKREGLKPGEFSHEWLCGRDDPEVGSRKVGRRSGSHGDHRAQRRFRNEAALAGALGHWREAAVGGREGLSEGHTSMTLPQGHPGQGTGPDAEVEGRARRRGVAAFSTSTGNRKKTWLSRQPVGVAGSQWLGFSPRS